MVMNVSGHFKVASNKAPPPCTAPGLSFPVKVNSLQLFSFSFVFYTKTREIDSDPVSISETEICSNFGGKNIDIFILSVQHDEPFREINSDPVSIAILRFDRVFWG